MSLRCGARASSVIAAGLLVAGLHAGMARAAVPFVDITSSGPLTSVTLGNDLSCQVAYVGDVRWELFPSSAKPGDCGTFLVVAGALYAPVLPGPGSTAASLIGRSTPFFAVSQSGVTGAGTSASPFKVTTVADAGLTGVRVTQVDSYVSGQESYRTDVTLANGAGAAASGVLYRAGDCYLQESDTGFGFVDTGAKAVGCSKNANNIPAGRIEQWYPITAGNSYMEGAFSQVWAHIATHTPFPNTTRATEPIDNGAGISWSYSLAPGAWATYSHYTTFSPRGIAGPPPALRPATPSAAFGPNGLLETPSNRRCLSRRYFRIKLRRKHWPIIVGVTVKMPGTTRVLRARPWGTIVDLRALPKGRFAVTVTAVTTTARTIKGTRSYRTCSGRLRGGRPTL